jgi:hypothetical protein
MDLPRFFSRILKVSGFASKSSSLSLVYRISFESKCLEGNYNLLISVFVRCRVAVEGAFMRLYIPVVGTTEVLSLRFTIESDCVTGFTM